MHICIFHIFCIKDRSSHNPTIKHWFSINSVYNNGMHRLRTVGCFMEYEERFLLLLRQSYKSEGNTWWLPAWKVEPGETDHGAMVREIFEETWFRVREEELEFLGVHTFTFPEYILDFSTFRLRLLETFDVVLDPTAHTAWLFVSRDECLMREDIIRGLPELVQEVYE